MQDIVASYSIIEFILTEESEITIEQNKKWEERVAVHIKCIHPSMKIQKIYNQLLENNQQNSKTRVLSSIPFLSIDQTF